MILHTRHKARGLLLLSAMSALATAVLAACIDPEERAPFEDPDGAPAASLPEAAADVAVDAVDARAPFDAASAAVVCATADGPCVTELAAGDDHVCARLRDGTVRCWGDDAKGALGVGADAGDGGRRPVVGLDAVAQISAAGASTCARDESGSVYCWGSNARGQLGLEAGAPFDDSPHRTPVRVSLPGPASRIDLGHGSACAVLADGGAVHCWGDNQHGQLARDPSDVVKPGHAMTGAPARSMRTGTSTGFVSTGAGTLLSVGAISGEEGVVAGRVSSISPDTTPATILTGVSSFAVSSSVPGVLPDDAPPWEPPPPASAHACAVVNGAALCWGRNAKGALCTGLPDPVAKTPTYAPVTSVAYPQQISVAGDTTCARLTDGTVQCCGTDDRGNLGRGATGAFSTFFVAATAFTERAVQVVTSRHAVCALVDDGTVACWGGNARGELGLPARDGDAHPTPVKVAF
ncbi:MAG: hypothetical protein KF819_13405 [Labilithrix sp.]|nr:hypothetical protein [Labilithrix sp.]